MSNLWKIFGLASTRKDFLNDIQKLREGIPARSFNNEVYHSALGPIDHFLFSWNCPLGHLDLEYFYDTIFCRTLWTNFGKVLQLSQLDTSSLEPSDPQAQALWQVFGLACIDPWRNKNPDGTDHTGFRHLLRQDKNAPDRFGFKLNDAQKTQIYTAINRPGVLDAMQDVAMCWDPGTFSMLLNRSEYPRLQPVQLPPGWINLTKP
jgi:hypothetical protein